MIEALSQHLHLNDAIESSIAKRSENRLLLLSALFTVDYVGVEATFLVQRPDFFCMVDRARDRDQLMLGSTLSKFLKLCKAAIDKMLVAGFGKGDTSTEPVILLQFEDLLKVVSTSTFIGKTKFDFCGRDVARLQPLDVAFHGSAAERIPEYQLAIDFLSVAAERRCRHVDNFGFRKTVHDLFPTLGRAMVSLVDNNHVEKIIGKLRQPLIDIRRELLNISDDDVRLSSDCDIAAVERAGERASHHLVLAQYGSFPPKAFLPVSDVRGVVKALLDGQVWR